MKKQLIFGLMAGTMALSLTACGGGNSETTAAASNDTQATADSTAASADSTAAAADSAAAASDWEGAEIAATLSGNVTYMHGGDDYERELYRGIFDDYEALAPGVKIEQLYVPSDYYTKLQTLAAGDSLPDIFTVGEGSLGLYASTGYLAPIDDYLKQYPALTADLADGLIDFGNYEGVQYGMIGGYTGYVMYLNKDLFKEAGVDLPTTDWTVEDYKNIAAQMTKKSEDGSRVDVYGTAINNYRADWINWMGNYDAEWFKDGKSNLTSPEAKQGLGVMYDLVQAGSAPSPGTVSATGDSEDRLFIVGKVAMYPSGAWCVTSFRNECDFEWDAIEMPKGTTHSSPFIGSLQCIGATSDVKDVAANILSYQYSDAGMEPIIKNTLYIPGFKHLLEREDLMAFPPSADAFRKCGEYIGSQSQLDVCKTGKSSEYYSIISARLGEAFEGQTTLDEALAAIDEQANTTVFTD